MFIEDIKIASPFRDLFPIREEVFERIVWDMWKNGYDPGKPIALWDRPRPAGTNHRRGIFAWRTITKRG
ncbi:MAG: hypothetical protein PHV82_15665 [Victivallaceae bacterium]|nr:hypothetical protein [Victivallaceae bacterium]